MQKRSRSTARPTSKRALILKALAALLAVAGAYYSPYGAKSQTSTEPSQSNTANTDKVYTGTVIKVHDADTINVRDTHGAIHKIRLHAVDAPELKQSQGQAAQRWFSDQLLNKEVKINVITKDRYQREVGKVLLPDPNCDTKTVCNTDQDMNLKLLENGHVWWYKDYAKEQSKQDKALYSAAEKNAKEQRIGLWKESNPTPPWAWRKARREEQGKD
jgi:endonuclease YncB( thermonuclease family)